LFLAYNSASPLFAKELPVLPVIIPYLEFIRKIVTDIYLKNQDKSEFLVGHLIGSFIVKNTNTF